MSRWKQAGLGVLLAAAGLGQAIAAPPSEQQVRKLMELVGVGQMLSSMNSQIMARMQQAVPCVPATYWQGFVDANATQQLIGRMVPIYQRHFSADDVDGLIKFYSSPLGQKVIKEMPATMGEGAQIGQQWSRERGADLIGQLQKEGKLDAQGRCPATDASPPDSKPAPATKAKAKGKARH